MQAESFCVTQHTSGTNVVQCELEYVAVSGRKCRQSSTMLNFQGQRWLALAFQPIRKVSQGHREPTHCSTMATHRRIRSPVYTSMHSATCGETCPVLLLWNGGGKHRRLRPLPAEEVQIQLYEIALNLRWMPQILTNEKSSQHWS